MLYEINRRRLHVRYDPISTEEHYEEVHRRLVIFMENHKIVNYILGPTHVILARNMERIRIKSLDMFAKEFGVQGADLIEAKNGTCKTGIVDLYVTAEGVDLTNLLSSDSIKEALNNRLKTMQQNEMLSNMSAGSVNKLVKSGACSIKEVTKLVEQREAMKEIDRIDAVLNQGELIGDIEMEYCLYDDEITDDIDELDKIYEPVEGVEPVKVLFRGYDADDPRAKLVKRKNLCIYSSNPNWGKSYNAKMQIIKKFRSQYIGDVNNATDLIEGVRLFVIDEYGRSNCFDLLTLKAITGGDSESKKMNRKSYGKSHNFPETSQFIILSNNSLYETYAKRKGNKYVLSKQVINQLRKRFRMVKLDGDDEMERLKFIDTDTLTLKERIERLKKLYIAKDGKRTECSKPSDVCDYIQLFTHELKESGDELSVMYHVLISTLETCLELTGEVEKCTWLDLCTIFYSDQVRKLKIGSDFLTDKVLPYDSLYRKQKKEIIATIITHAEEDVKGVDEKSLLVGEFMEAMCLASESKKKSGEEIKRLTELSRSKKHFAAMTYFLQKEIGDKLVREKAREAAKEEMMLDFDIDDMCKPDVKPVEASPKKRKMDFESEGVIKRRRSVI